MTCGDVRNADRPLGMNETEMRLELLQFVHTSLRREHFRCSEVVVRERIELSTFRFSGAIELCLRVARRRLTGHLGAPIVSGRRRVSLGVCLRWLPVWLPGPAGG